MWLEAILTREDLEKALRDVTPFKVRLGEDGELAISEPSEVALVPDQGLRVACKAEIRWPVLGITVPISVDKATLVITPLVAQQLTFKIQVEHVDVAMLPKLLDHSLTAKVNKELLALELTWAFAKTLAVTAKLPPVLLDLAALHLDVAWGKVRITREALVFAVSFRTVVRRRTES